MKLRLVLIAAVSLAVLAITGCPNIGIPENTVTFTYDGVDYSLSAAPAGWLTDHAYAIGWINPDPPPVQYTIQAKATSTGSEGIEIYFNLSEDTFHVSAVYTNASGAPTLFDIGYITINLMDGLIQNLDNVGEQFIGSLPGPFSDGGSHTLKDIVFSVERLPDMIPD